MLFRESNSLSSFLLQGFNVFFVTHLISSIRLAPLHPVPLLFEFVLCSFLAIDAIPSCTCESSLMTGVGIEIGVGLKEVCKFAIPFVGSDVSTFWTCPEIMGCNCKY